MRLVFLSGVLFLGLGKAFAQENYDVSLIPKDLLAHANTVVRNEEQRVGVKDINTTVEHIKKAVTILNKNGDENAQIELYYDKEDAVKYIKGVVYNEFGKPVGKFSESDFADESVADGFSLFNGQRKKYYQPAIPEYPYTIVYELEIRSKQTLDLENWEPRSGTEEAIEKSTFVFSCKPDFKIRYKETNIANKATIGLNNDKEKTYTWQLTNLKATKYESLSPYYRDIDPSVQIAPEKFSYFGLEGSFTDWSSLGKWIYDKLVAGRQEIPQATMDHIKDITRDIADPKLKAKKIYEFMQHKTHYVSVQIGIGGYQPFLASDVDNQNYGDCKALVNYTQALLKAVNIDSWYCVVKSGGRYKVSMQSDFASMSQGDHIILCIPFKNDTTWADCTNQTIPFGYLGDFTDDRTVLACTPGGGKLLHTPKYTVDDDLENRKASFVVGADGTISGSMNTVYKGVFFEERDELVNESSTEQNKILQKLYPINNMVVNHYELRQDKSFSPSTTEKIQLTARDYASFTDGKYYFMVNPVNRIEGTPRQVTNRQNEVYINRGYTDIDEVSYTIPAGYHLEKEPLNIKIDKPFGKFSATMELNGGQLIYRRKLQLFDGTYKKDIYQEVVDFFQDAVDADSYTVSLAKN